MQGILRVCRRHGCNNRMAQRRQLKKVGGKEEGIDYENVNASARNDRYAMCLPGRTRSWSKNESQGLRWPYRRCR